MVAIQPKLLVRSVLISKPRVPSRRTISRALARLHYSLGGNALSCMVSLRYVEGADQCLVDNPRLMMLVEMAAVALPLLR